MGQNACGLPRPRAARTLAAGALTVSVAMLAISATAQDAPPTTTPPPQETPAAQQQPGGATTAAPPAAPPAAPAPARTDQRRPAPGAAQPTEPYSVIRVSEYMTVDMFVNDADILHVLQQLSLQTRRNIVPSARVSGRITANLYGVSFNEALRAILNPNGLGSIEDGEFIYVYTLDELGAQQRSALRPVSRIIHLNYLTSTDAMRFATPKLSSIGVIVPTQDQSDRDGESSDSTGSGSEDDDPVYRPGESTFSLSNSIVVYDYADRIDDIEELLRQLDSRPAQVLIEATIVQAELTEANAFGVDFALLPDVQFTDFFNFPGGFNPIDFVRPDPDSSDAMPSTRPSNNDFVVSNPGNTGAGRATVRAGISFGDAGIFIRALDEVTDVSLLSNPKILTLNRQRARILVGQRVGYLETTVVENQVLQTVRFIDTGIELDFRVFIGADDTVRLELRPKVSDVVFRNVTSQTGLVQQIPDENIQTVSTHIVVPKGATAVLGGLFREDSDRSRSQVPVLGDIPLIGLGFRGHDDSISRSEIIFLVKPTLIADQTIRRQGDEALMYANRVRVGSREGLLPWSRERQTAQLNVEAERAAAAGDIDAAMWKIRRSLELSPSQPDAIRIREKLVKRPDVWPTRSWLERITDRELDSRFPDEWAIPPAADPFPEPDDDPEPSSP